MFKSIFGRMFWTYAILLIVVLTTMTSTMALIFGEFTERNEIGTINSVAHTIEFWTGELQITQTDARSSRAYRHLLQSWSKFVRSDITVMNRDGEVFDSTCGITEVPQEFLGCIETDEIITKKSDFGGFYENKVLTVAFPIHYKDNIIGAILFNRGIADLRHTVTELLFLFTMSSLLSMLLAFIIIYVQAKNISAPITAINKAAQMIAAGNFSERVDITSEDEIGQLASTFNFMASSIEKSDRSRQRFVSDVSHELRTPMTSISGFVQGMLDGTITDDERDDYLKIVLDESNRLTRLVNDMLEMSKMQADNFKLNITPFNINDLICTCLVSLEQRIESKHLDAAVDFRPDRLITLGDKDQIKRVLLNLLDNAIKFSHENTTIKINTWIAGGKAHVSVSNTGDGMSAEECRHVFDRFYKTDASREKDRTGAGLGLSLVHNIIRLHNQTIQVQSVPDEGSGANITTFFFTLEVE